jgi:hypothetical protein
VRHKGSPPHFAASMRIVEFCCRYFDSSGANRSAEPADRLQRPTKVPLGGDGFFHPDAVFAVSAPDGARAAGCANARKVKSKPGGPVLTTTCSRRRPSTRFRLEGTPTA